jgi:hypothetical protein
MRLKMAVGEILAHVVNHALKYSLHLIVWASLESLIGFVHRDFPAICGWG